MDHSAAENLQWEPAPQENFTGRVWFGELSRDPVNELGLVSLGVLFQPGARTDWHSHPAGQVLYMVSGAGYVQTDTGETVAVSAGEVVYSPPGELHWHGAASSSYLMHLSLTTGGSTEWIGRKVSSAEYPS